MKQQPVESAFGASSTAAQVLEGMDLTGKLAIVTGAGGGIGLATAKALYEAGADVLMAGRTRAKLSAVRDELAATLREGALQTHALDLMSIRSIDAFADAALALDRPVDILINNAAVIGPFLTNDLGIESGLMTNYVGHAILTSRLAPALLRASTARIISVSSFGHHYSPVVFDDLNFSRRQYSAWNSYGQSKTGCCLLAVKVSNALASTGLNAFTLHPGAILTELPRSMVQEDFDLAAERGSIPAEDAFKSPDQGAATTVWAATAPTLAGRGPLYLEDCAVAPLLETPTYRYGVMPYALDPEAAERLWRAAEQMMGRTLSLKQ